MVLADGGTDFPIRLFSATIFVCSSMLTAFLICPLWSWLLSCDWYFFPLSLKAFSVHYTLLIAPDVTIDDLMAEASFSLFLA